MIDNFVIDELTINPILGVSGMDQNQIKALIAEGESQTLEFKETFGNDAKETVGSFSNTKGGIILIGVSDDRRLKNFSLGDESLVTWISQIRDVTQPIVIPNIEHVVVDNSNVVVITVPEHQIKPVSVRGRFYKRVDRSDREMTAQEIAECYLSSVNRSPDEYVLVNAHISDIDPSKVIDYVTKANASRRKNITDSDPNVILNRLGLIRNGQPTLASIVLFGKSPSEIIPQATIRCGRFKQGATIIDAKSIKGTAIEQVEDAIKFIQGHIKLEYLISDKPQREEIWEYPLEAIREAIVNAICHRDYFDLSEIEIKIYDDRLTIWNPGGLVPGLTINDLYRTTHSHKPRNRIINEVLYDVGLGERYGSGIQRIFEACANRNLPRPKLEELSAGFQITFIKDIFTPEYIEKLGLTEEQKKAIQYVREKGRITNKDYQKINGIDSRRATYELGKLIEKGIIERIGQGRGIYYQFRKDLPTVQ